MYADMLTYYMPVITGLVGGLKAANELAKVRVKRAEKDLKNL